MILVKYKESNVLSFHLLIVKIKVCFRIGNKIILAFLFFAVDVWKFKQSFKLEFLSIL